IKELQQENEKRKEENKALREKEMQLLKMENELKDRKESLELEVEKRIMERRDKLAEEIRQKETDKNELKFKEYEKQLEDQRKLIEEMKRKSEQASQQTQGEVQELALEENLKTLYPFDVIEEVPKGVQGSDVIQTVVNNFQQHCGSIIYESKRTKSFGNDWIDKLKEDQRNQGADLAVIVTEAMPKDMEKFGRKDGIWICRYHEVKSVTFVLREMLIRTYSVQSAEENKSDKMEMLYRYLTGDEFRQRIEAIVEGFTSLKSDIDKEKQAMQKIWKAREKQVEKVISNTIDMYGSIKGIAGSAVQEVKALELDEPKKIDKA
ncbi:MAG: DUF2130 domain-containing protein, partial [Caldithrix sp.]|nr:DUF2130 domain-containing protein [Caldithrix sp.]